ncbi:MAG TPA: succinylglutamate desuccinylase/aspartoacylase family protein [Streptosporangiaceae bacterium]
MPETRTFTIDTLPGAAPLDVPYAEVRGERDGPRLTVVAGVHGTEYTSIAAVREFVQALDPAALAGSVTAVPVMNPPAFWARSPFVVPVDGKNLNRSFPGDPGGGYTDVLAHRLFQRFATGTDYLLDLHAGDLPEALEPFTIYDESPVEEAARGLAAAYGLGHVVRQAAAGRTVGGSTSAAAADAGIPAIIAEAGQNGVLDRASVELHRAGLANVLAHLGMTGGTVPAASPEEHPGWEWLRTPVDGWWEPAVATGERVAAGDRLGVVSGLLGGVAHEVVAPVAGVPLFLTSSPAVVEDGLLLGLARQAGA